MLSQINLGVFREGKLDTVTMGVIVLISVALLLIFFLRSSLQRSSRHSPPSPRSIPLIGHLHLFGKQEPPHQTLARISRRYGPYMLLRFGSNDMLVVSSADAARDVLKNHDLAFSSRPKTLYTECLAYDGSDLIFAPYGDHWRSLRKLCTLELLTMKRIDEFRPLRSAEMAALVIKLEAASERGEAVDMTDSLSCFTLNVMLKMIIGKSYSNTNENVNDEEARDAYRFGSLFHESNQLAQHFHVGDCFPWLKWLPDSAKSKLKKIGEEMDEFLQAQVDEHRTRFDKVHLKDFLDVLISVLDNSSLSNKTIKALAWDMIGAGSETSATAAQWILAEVVHNPEVKRRIQQELDTEIDQKQVIVSEDELPKLKYLQAVVKESFRLHPPVPLLLPHESVTDCKLEAGYRIARKTQLLVNAYAIGRDPGIWEDPLEFKPERMIDGGRSVELGQSFDVLPFGYGRRSCPGLNLGLTTVHLILANLLCKFDWKAIHEADDDLRERAAFGLQSAHPLKLIPVSRTF